MPITYAVLFVTEDCNLRCPYCYVPKSPRRLDPAMGREVVDFMLDAPPRAKSVMICFFGGEPLLEFDTIRELIEYGEQRSQEADKRIKFGMTTNGTLLTDEIIDFATEHKLTINFSMDGGPESHNANRRTVDGKGSFEFVDQALKRLAARKYGHNVRLTFDAATVDRLFDNVQYLWDRGCGSISPQPVLSDGWTDEHLAVAKEQIERIGRGVLAEARRGKYRRIAGIHRLTQRLAKNGRRPKRACGAGSGLIAVDVEGNIYPCQRLLDHDEMRFGNLDEVAHRDVREAWLTFDSRRLEGCDDCRVAHVCAGGCTGANYMCTGDIYRPSPLQCEFIRMQYDVAKWLHRTLKAECNSVFERGVLRKTARQARKPDCVP